MAWTPEKIKQLTRLWNKGKSTVEIAKELGISKNAVVGKVHRLELDARPSPIRTVNRPGYFKRQLTAVRKDRIGLLDLKINSCRWPYGDPGDEKFHFCGKECQTGKPYCPEHCKIAYTSLKELAMESARAKKEAEMAAALNKAGTAVNEKSSANAETPVQKEDVKSVSLSDDTVRKETGAESVKEETAPAESQAQPPLSRNKKSDGKSQTSSVSDKPRKKTKSDTPQTRKNQSALKENKKSLSPKIISEGMKSLKEKLLISKKTVRK